MTRFFATLAALVLCSAAQAQTYPDRTAPGVNDFANIIDEPTEARIAETLAAIKDDHDVEATVVTLSSLRFYANNTTIETYAETLFNTWGIGNAERNDGILIIVFRDDRELRLQVGSAYGEDQQDQFTRLVAEDILPAFRNDDFAGGLENGVNALVARIIAPPAANTAPAGDSASDSEGGGNTLYYVLGAVGAAILGLIGLNRRNAAKFAAQPCSQCGKPGLEKSREVLRDATLEMEGAGETRISCPACGHVDRTPYTISKLKPEEPEGGGKSDGGGATGKW